MSLKTADGSRNSATTRIGDKLTVEAKTLAFVNETTSPTPKPDAARSN
jgi:hypothetical protein